MSIQTSYGKKSLFFAFFVPIAIAFGYSSYTKKWSPSNNNTVLERPHACDGKKYCITAFIAPWCGVCNRSIPTFHALHKFLPTVRPDVGFGMVIGAGDLKDSERKRQELSEIDAFVDASGDVMKKNQIRAFPTWIISDEKGREIRRRASGLSIASESEVSQFVAQAVGH